jgi:prepilin-type N-terminal cleavage/methylation domain-containing protein
MKMLECRTIASQRASRGFTLVETLAAMLLMAIVIPVAIQGMAIANRAGIVAERKKIAVTLADRLLTEKIVTKEWIEGDNDGDFGEDQPGYTWILRSATWEEEDTMRKVRVEVHFKVQGQDYSVSLATLVAEEEAES